MVSPESHVTSTKPVVLMSCVNAVTRKNNLWYLDSGASDHVTHDRRVSTSGEFQTLVVGNDTILLVVEQRCLERLTAKS